MDAFTWFTGIIGSSIALTVLFIALVIGFNGYLYHRRRMIQIRGLQSEECKRLEQRIEELEKRCNTLHDQLIETHEQLADERRQLDRKLTAMLPEDTATDAKTVGERKRARG